MPDKATRVLRLPCYGFHIHEATAMSLTTDRVRSHTSREVLRRIDADTVGSLDDHGDASPEKISERLGELDREWDTDRVLETEAALTGLLGLALGTFVRPQLLALPVMVAAGVLTHALTGHYPLMPLFRRLRVRTSREIAHERYALKALRGDFTNMGGGEQLVAAAPTNAQPECCEVQR
ncbi:MAG: hypothetical protein ACXW16_03830 [Burkholderiaceae bacterium]